MCKTSIMQKIYNYITTHLKDISLGLSINLQEEDNLSTRDKWPVPKVSSLWRFYCNTLYKSPSIIMQLFPVSNWSTDRSISNTNFPDTSDQCNRLHLGHYSCDSTC